MEGEMKLLTVSLLEQEKEEFMQLAKEKGYGNATSLVRIWVKKFIKECRKTAIDGVKEAF